MVANSVVVGDTWRMGFARRILATALFRSQLLFCCAVFAVALSATLAARAADSRRICDQTVTSSSYTGTFPSWLVDGTAEIYGTNFSGVVFLGRLSTNEFASDSILNEFGSYGSQFSSTSIFNSFGTWGSAFSSSGVCNTFASSSSVPQIVWKGQVVGRLTANEFASNAVSPVSLVAALLALRYRDFVPPTIPTSLTMVARSATEVQLSWAASFDESGVIVYRVYLNGALLGSVATNGTTITNLAPATSYQVTVSACDGSGNCSAQSAPLTISSTATAPGAPLVGTATAGNGQATVTFSAPTSNGGATITSYTVTSSPGNVTATGAASPITVTGLTNGTAYTFSVAATNAAGTGPSSAASNSVTPVGPPGAPTGVTAASGIAQATVSFTAPASNGGSAITGYTVTSSPGGITASGAGSPITVSGLTNGTTYTFTVTATNARGTGPASAASNSVTPTDAPTPPTLTPASFDFGGQSMRTTRTAAFTLTNAAAATISVTSITVSGTGFAVTHDCGATLAAGASCTATIGFTPTVEGAASGTLTAATSARTQTATLSGAGERSLTSHYYRSILRRAPDAGGKQFWEAEAARVASLGANVNETWFAMAMSFYNSSEYLALGRNPTEYVRDLYNTFFNRNADDAGLNYWTGQMSAGMPREIVLVSFMFSTEFTQFAQAIFGNTQARAEVDTVVDFYRGLLSRLPDSSGFGFWVGQFRQAQCHGGNAMYEKVEAISSAYANSAEYGARGRSNAQYVGDLYNAFLRRGGDLDGVKFWMGQLDSGAQSRDQLRRAFIASSEFSARVAAVVAQGCHQ